MDITIEPTHLSGKNSAISRVPGEINQQSAVWPSLMEWLCSATRGGTWECADAKQCKGHHECKAGSCKGCDAAVCYLRLLHPTDESRWIVLHNSNSRWLVAMSMDECIHYSGKGKIFALTKDFGSTRADIWRASVKAVAHGRKEIVTPASRPADTPAGDTLPGEADSKLADDKSV